MNKKTAAIVSGTAGLILTLGACSTATYQYKVSGTVQGQQITYNCPGKSVAMDIVSFETGGKKKRNSGSNTAPSPRPLVSKKPTGRNTQKPSSGVTTSNTSKPSPSATTAKVKSNTGVTLSEKPEAPELAKNGTVPTPAYRSRPKGCKVDDYEIFVLNGSGDLYEQDVRKVDYDRCSRFKGTVKLFPRCTKG
jgi:hypothetical protein